MRHLDMIEQFDRRLKSGALVVAFMAGEGNKRARDCRRCGGNVPKQTGTLINHIFHGFGDRTYLCVDCSREVRNQLRGDE